MIDYNSVLSSRIQSVRPSGIRRFFDLANSSGLSDIISLSIGEPDFATPWHIRQAAIDSIEKGRTFYSPNRGFTDLLESVSEYCTRRFGLTYDPHTEILVTVGGSEAIDCALRCLVSPGDEVLIPQPSFVCYEPLTVMAGGVPVPIVTEAKDEFRLTADALKNAITSNTKVLILPFPNNPTGAIMEKSDLEAIAEVVIKHDIFVMSDEIYAELTYKGEHVSIASLPGMQERTIVINGFSKAYAMTGWRLGYVCAPKEILKQMLKIHQYAIMCAPTTSQYAGIKAPTDGDADIEYMKNHYDQRRRLILKGLWDMGIECFEPEGAFYVFPNIGKFGMKSEEFCEKLLYGKKVAIVPGTAFGDSGEGFARISYAYSVDHISEALEKLEKFIKEIK